MKDLEFKAWNKKMKHFEEFEGIDFSNNSLVIRFAEYGDPILLEDLDDYELSIYKGDKLIYKEN